MPPKVIATLRPEDLVVPTPGMDALPVDELKAILQAVAGDHSFEATGLQDTPIRREVYDKVRAEAAEAGVEVDIPFFD